MENQQNQIAVAVPQVNKQEAESFSKVWRYNGIVVQLDDASLQFAADFANIVLVSIYRLMIAQAQQVNRPLVMEGQ